MDSKTRGRYVFQMRIPVVLRALFGGRAAVRVVLGRITAEQARERGEALAAQWRARFAQIQSHAVPSAAHKPCVCLALHGEDERARLVATGRALEVERMRARLDVLRADQATDWRLEEERARARLDELRQIARSGHRAAALQTLDEIEVRFSVRIDAVSRAMPELIDALNSDAVVLGEAWGDILLGRRALASLTVQPRDMLALRRICGTDARTLVERHEARLATVGKALLRDTRQKYVALAAALAAVLGECPVEHIKPHHLSALLELWRARGNGAKTLLDKMSALAMLIAQVSEEAAALVRSQRPPVAVRSVTRLPMPAATLAALRHRLLADGRYSDDSALLDLMVLTGARFGEILQLRAENLILNGAQALVSLDGPRLKTPASRRQIPVLLEGLVQLRKWLEARIALGGALFPDARADAHGRLGNAESKRINRALRALCPDRRIVLESTRNAAAHAMRRGGVDPRVRRRALGHADVSVHDRHYDPAEELDGADLAAAAPVLNAVLRAACEEVAAGVAGSVLIAESSRPGAAALLCMPSPP